MTATDPNRSSVASNRLLRAAVTDPRAWLATAGIFLYVILRLGYSTFYQPLGVSPEDLGFGYLDILAQAAVGFVVLAVVFAIALLLIGAEFAVLVVVCVAFVKTLWSLVREIWSGLRGLVGHRRARSDRDDAKGEVTSGDSSAEPCSDGTSDGEGVAAALEPGAPERSSSSTGQAGDGSRRLVVAPLVIRRPSPRQPVAARRWAVAWRWGAGYISVVCVLIAAVLILQAAADRRAVEHGEPRVPTVMGFRIASWGAHRATVEAVAEQPRRELVALENLCLLYLGTHDGTVFLYEPRARETLRLPAASVLVHTYQSGTCRVRPNR